MKTKFFLETFRRFESSYFLLAFFLHNSLNWLFKVSLINPDYFLFFLLSFITKFLKIKVSFAVSFPRYMKWTVPRINPLVCGVDWQVTRTCVWPFSGHQAIKGWEPCNFHKTMANCIKVNTKDIFYLFQGKTRSI